MSQERILQRIQHEREYQDGKWGTEFDDKNTANDWVSYILRYAAMAAEFNISKEAFENSMIKVAALAVAAVESTERNSGLPPRHYD